MATETYILLILGLSFLLAVIKTAIRESLQNSKPTNINYGTINHHYYGFENPQGENKTIMRKKRPQLKSAEKIKMKLNCCQSRFE
ncbi:MAG: hypothetical protein AB1477_05155 [Acidobacteriota bacterium]